MRRALALVPLWLLLAGCGGWSFSVANHEDHRAPLEKAAQSGDLAEVRRLLASGADPNDRGGMFGAPLMAAAARPHNADVIRELIAAGANSNGRAGEGNSCWVSPVSLAASMGDVENMRSLFDAGAVLPKSNCSRLVVGWLQPSVIDLLLQHGLDILQVDDLGRNELHVALAPPVSPRFAGIERLVRAGVPLNARDHAGKTPLAYWREPRDFEAHRFRSWLFERLSSDQEFRRQREDRANISALLERSGAPL